MSSLCNWSNHARRLIIRACWPIALSLAVQGCSGSTQRNGTIGDLVQHLKGAGLQGEYKPKFAGVIGAKEGGGYSGDGFQIEIYRFEDVAMAESLEKTGMSGKPVHRNGRFVLLVHEGEAKVLPPFQRF